MTRMMPMSRQGADDTAPKAYYGEYLGKRYTPSPPKPMIIQKPFQRALELAPNGKDIPVIGHPNQEQWKALCDIAICKTSDAGFSVYQCSACDYQSYNFNKCKNRNCPVCQNLKTLVWIDNRQAEVIDAPYYHVVMTLPHELNPLIYENQKVLYGLLHKSLSASILELARDSKYLGGTPGIIQVLHTWNQELKYHVHVHAIVTGAGLTPDGELVYGKSDTFLFPEKVLSSLVKAKYMATLKELHDKGALSLTGRALKFRNSYEWKELVDTLYKTDWVSYIKETFDGNGNAIEYLARYTNKVAIGNSRIVSVTSDTVTFTKRGEDGKQSQQEQLPILEFVGRFLQHVLPAGFQKIRYYGFLANGCRKKKLAQIFKKQGRQKFMNRYKAPTEAEALRVEFHVDLSECPNCGRTGTMFEADMVLGYFTYTYIPLGLKKCNRKSFHKPRGRTEEVG